jgi:hypothetical protein
VQDERGALALGEPGEGVPDRHDVRRGLGERGGDPGPLPRPCVRGASRPPAGRSTAPEHRTPKP